MQWRKLSHFNSYTYQSFDILKAGAVCVNKISSSMHGLNQIRYVASKEQGNKDNILISFCSRSVTEENHTLSLFPYFPKNNYTDTVNKEAFKKLSVKVVQIYFFFKKKDSLVQILE